MTKVICISDCWVGSYFEEANMCFENRVYYYLFDIWSNNYEIYSEDKIYMGMYASYGKFEKHFITAAEWRERQINLILNDGIIN